ncbi:MAG: hypothetical protein ACI8TP_001620 [Acidimicrobiales bacterium]|jgi:hypothetical protein
MATFNNDIKKVDTLNQAETIVINQAETIVMNPDGTATVELHDTDPSLGPIVVSHAHADKEIVKALLQLVGAGLEVKTRDILATSVLGSKIPAGENWSNYLRERLEDTALVLMVLTPNFMKSDFCKIELGAVWVQEKKVIPIVIPPLEAGALEPSILNDLQCINVGVDEGLKEARSAVASALGQDPAPEFDLSGHIARFRKTFQPADVST